MSRKLRGASPVDFFHAIFVGIILHYQKVMLFSNTGVKYLVATDIPTEFSPRSMKKKGDKTCIRAYSFKHGIGFRGTFPYLDWYWTKLKIFVGLHQFKVLICLPNVENTSLSRYNNDISWNVVSYSNTSTQCDERHVIKLRSGKISRRKLDPILLKNTWKTLLFKYC